ncbi:UNVERIFIED_CONTAM: hypothetical protein K2H54_070509 [Gekko kuhli]
MAAAAAAPPSPPPSAAPLCPGSWPNFAVVCSFLERYGALLDLPELPFPELERVLQPPQEPGEQGCKGNLRIRERAGGRHEDERKTPPPPLGV